MSSPPLAFAASNCFGRITDTPPSPAFELAHDAGYHDLLREIRAHEGEAVENPPLLFKLTVAVGCAMIAGGLLGIVPRPNPSHRRAVLSMATTHLLPAAPMRTARGGGRWRLSAAGWRVLTEDLIRVADVAAIAMAWLAVTAWRFDGEPIPDAILAGLFIGCLLAMNILPYMQVYRADRLRSPSSGVPRVIFGLDLFRRDPDCRAVRHEVFGADLPRLARRVVSCGCHGPSGCAAGWQPVAQAPGYGPRSDPPHRHCRPPRRLCADADHAPGERGSDGAGASPCSISTAR